MGKHNRLCKGWMLLTRGNQVFDKTLHLVKALNIGELELQSLFASEAHRQKGEAVLGHQVFLVPFSACVLVVAQPKIELSESGGQRL